MKSNHPYPTPIFDSLSKLKENSSAPVKQIGIAKDHRLAFDFLKSYRGSEGTYNAYRRDIERLLHWTWIYKDISVVNLKRADIEAFIEFCQDPPIHWIGTKNVARFKAHRGERKPNPEWRPFTITCSKRDTKHGKTPDKKKYAYSGSQIKATFAILSTFYNFLIQEEITESNPVLLIRQKSRYIRKTSSKRVIRRLTNDQWRNVIETAQELAEKHPREHERTLFILYCSYSMYLRVSEFVVDDRHTPTMGDFHKDSNGLWWFKTVGKRNKERDIPVSDAMLDALKRYRLSQDISSLPTPGETTPLLYRLKGKGGIASTRQISYIMQYAFDLTYRKMRDAGLYEQANELEIASMHWLRHTGISEDVKIRPLEHVRDDSGHGTIITTDGYIDNDEVERHRSARSRPMTMDEIKPD